MVQRFLRLENPLREFVASHPRLKISFLSVAELELLRGAVPALNCVQEAMKIISSNNYLLGRSDTILEVGSLSRTENLRNCLICKRLKYKDSEYHMPKSTHSIVFQGMVANLDRLRGSFAARLSWNCCMRIKMRRDLPARFARYLDERELTSSFDRRLQLMNTQSHLQEEERDLEKYIIRCLKKARVGTTARSTTSGDHDYGTPRAKKRYEDLTDEQLFSSLRVFEAGLMPLPKEISATLLTVLPTSVPAERLFSKARYARQCNQERMGDARFGKLVLLKDFYVKSQPWGRYTGDRYSFMPFSNSNPSLSVMRSLLAANSNVSEEEN